MDSDRFASSGPERPVREKARDSAQSRAPYGWLSAAAAIYAVAFLVYAEKWAFAWDESYHLLAAQLIGRGKRPYIDFCFPQTLLNVYWNAAWMRLLGDNWRVPHVFAALFTMGAVALTARFLFRRFPVPGWRTAAAVAAALLVGLNAKVFGYAPLAQPYGICLFTLLAAFQWAVVAVDRSKPLPAAATGFFAGAAAASSLLTAAATPVLLVWMMFYNRAGSRWAKFWAFCVGTAIPFAPVIWLSWQGPRQAWFNLVRYHASFRRLYWPETTRHDLEVLTSWIDSGQALLIGLLAIAGLVFIARGSRWPAATKAEFYLSAWLAAALSAEVAAAHPTFPQYFLLAVPFLAILAAVGLYAVAARMFQPAQPLWAVLPVLLITALGLAKSIYEDQDMGDWSIYERLASKIDEVTPPNAPVFADEPIYFLTRRVPPPGLELAYTHKVDLGPAENALLHIVTIPELQHQLQAGMFATAYSCFDTDIKLYGLADLYQKRLDMDECSIFWDLKKH